MKTSIPWRRLDQKGKSGTKKIQKKVLTVPVQPLQPKKKTDIIKATSVFFAALLQSRAGPAAGSAPRKRVGAHPAGETAHGADGGGTSPMSRACCI